MHSAKIIGIGNSLGVVLPRDVLARLGLEKGDMLYLTDAPDGLRLTAYNPEFEAQMHVAKRLLKRRRAALRQMGG